MLNVSYRIKQDTNSWFSYSSEHPVMTLDPVSTGPLGWETFLTAFNDFCSEHHGVPLFNQTKWITRHQARKAFGVRLEQFEQERRGLDPKGRLLNEYFREKLS